MTTTKKKTTAPKAVKKPAAKTTATKTTKTVKTVKSTPATPKYENTFKNAMSGFWANALDWGRATRAEYWWSVLIYSFIVPTFLMFAPALLILWYLATLVPSFTLVARRLHDTNRSNWNILWLMLPYIGVIVLIVLLCLEGNKEANKFGQPRI